MLIGLHYSAESNVSVACMWIISEQQSNRTDLPYTFLGALLADLSTNLLFQDPLVSWMRTKKQIAIDWI